MRLNKHVHHNHTSDVDCPDDCPGHDPHFDDLATHHFAIPVDYFHDGRTRHVDQHDCTANHCPGEYVIRAAHLDNLRTALDNHHPFDFVTDAARAVIANAASHRPR